MLASTVGVTTWTLLKCGADAHKYPFSSPSPTTLFWTHDPPFDDVSDVCTFPAAGNRVANQFLDSSHSHDTSSRRQERRNDFDVTGYSSKSGSKQKPGNVFRKSYYLLVELTVTLEKEVAPPLPFIDEHYDSPSSSERLLLNSHVWQNPTI